MRTKTLLLAAALSTAGIAAYAQSNVYSVNVVGYVNVTIPANAYGLIANPLNSTNNTIGSLIPNPPVNTSLYKYNGGYTTYTFDELDNVWYPDALATLNPGEGAFIKNVTGTPMTLTFVGEVLQGALSNPLPTGYAIRSSKVPQAGAATGNLGFPAQPNDSIFKYAGGYTTYTFDELDNVWYPNDPVINVGEAFFSKKIAGEAWNRNFTVQ